MTTASTTPEPVTAPLLDARSALLDVLGDGCPGGTTWAGPRLAAELDAVLADAGAAGRRSTARHEGAFAARLHLVHAWRRSLHVDPALPAELLPADWPGTTAAARFDEQAARLLPAARRYVETCLAAAGSLLPTAPEGHLPCPPPSGTAPCSSTSTPASPRSSSTARRA